MQPVGQGKYLSNKRINNKVELQSNPINYNLLNVPIIDTVELSKPKKPDKKFNNFIDQSLKKLNSFKVKYLGNQKTGTSIDLNEISISSPVPGGGQTNAQQSTALDQKIGDISQGNQNDCWLLSSIKAIANDPEGEKIIVNSITRVSGGYQVSFKGAPGKTYDVSESEVLKAKQTVIIDPLLQTSNTNYATGDDDVTILEIAANKHYGGLESRSAAEGFKLLLGKESHKTVIADTTLSILDNYNKYFMSLSKEEQNEALGMIKKAENIDKEADIVTRKQDEIDAKMNLLIQKYNELDKKQKIIYSEATQYIEDYDNADQETQRQMGGLKERNAKVKAYKTRLQKIISKMNVLDKQIDELSCQMDVENQKAEKINEAVDWYQKNTKLACSYLGRQQALEILQKAEKENDQVSITASRLYNPNDRSSYHGYIVTIDQKTGDILVNNPHDTSKLPERYKTKEEFLSKYIELHMIEDITN